MSSSGIFVERSWIPHGKKGFSLPPPSYYSRSRARLTRATGSLDLPGRKDPAKTRISKDSIPHRPSQISSHLPLDSHSHSSLIDETLVRFPLISAPFTS